jgi:hypothetical protein
LDANIERSVKFKGEELNHLHGPYKKFTKNLKRKKEKHPSKAISSLQTPGTSNKRILS